MMGLMGKRSLEPGELRGRDPQNQRVTGFGGPRYHKMQIYVVKSGTDEVKCVTIEAYEIPIYDQLYLVVSLVTEGKRR
jgi:hypothetical protein